MLSEMEETFFAALDSSPDELLCLVVKNQTRPSKAALKSAIHRSSKKQAAGLCSSLAHFANVQALAFQNLDNSQFEHVDCFKTPSPKHKRRKRACSSPAAEAKGQVQGSENSGRRGFVMASLKACAMITQFALSHPLKAFQPCDLFPAVQILHDQLVFFEDDLELQDIIATLCEFWWKDNLPGRESLIAQFLPFLLSKSLEVSRKVNVHRVYSMREAFVLFDFIDETIEDLKHLLMRCVLTPSHLRSPDGCRFISFLVNINVQLTKELIVMVVFYDQEPLALFCSLLTVHANVPLATTNLPFVVQQMFADSNPEYIESLAYGLALSPEIFELKSSLKAMALMARAETFDWSRKEINSHSFDTVLASDVLYEKGSVPYIAELLPNLIQSGSGKVIMTDPTNRTPQNREEFLSLLGCKLLDTKQQGLKLERMEKVKLQLNDKTEDVVLMQFCSR
ncbi:hypothetical protein L7F22_002069 [Adiantum nelumboides]|nr:hypothetical protein [Adiantum nelumboides]